MLVTTEVSVADIVANVDRNEALLLVRELDNAQEDWDFTFQCLEHFLDQVSVAKNEEHNEEVVQEFERLLREKRLLPRKSETPSTKTDAALYTETPSLG